MKKGELYCINVANYVHKVVFYDNTVLELKKKKKLENFADGYA